MEYLLRSFFPKLRVLVVLIDDKVDFDEVWPEYGDENEDEASGTESESVDDPVDYSDGVFGYYSEDEDLIPRV